MSRDNRFFTTRTIATLAMLTALGYGLSWLEFPLFPAAPFLKLDFSTFVTLFGGYMFGPLGAIVIEGIKQLLIWGTKSTTGGVGEVANFIMATSFVIVPTVLYRFKRYVLNKPAKKPSKTQEPLPQSEQDTVSNNQTEPIKTDSPPLE